MNHRTNYVFLAALLLFTSTLAYSLHSIATTFGLVEPLPFSPSHLTAQAASSLTQGLVAHYTFDEGSGTSAVNAAGSSSGTLNNATWVSGKIGANAIDLDGSTAYMNASGDPIGTNTVTLSAWIYPKALSTISIVAANGNNSFYAFVSSSNNRLVCSNNGGNTSAWSANNAISLNQWQFITVVRDTDGTCTLYVNGMQSGTAHQNAGTIAAGSSFYVGRRPTPAYYLKGSLDDVRVYNRALSATEISDLYAYTGITVSQPPSGPTNAAPTVSVGSNQTITLPTATVTLTGIASDDNLPAGSAFTTLWSVVSGGAVTFGNISNLSTTATFTSPGTYILRLTASDGALTSYADTTITVNPAPVITPTPPPSASGTTIPNDRKIDWTSTGVPGGIPQRTTLCATIDAATYGNGITDASPAIQAALNNCPENQVVFIPAGTYKLASRINFGFSRNKVTIRGAGADATILVPAGDAFLMGSDNYNAAKIAGAGVTVNSGAVKGSTQLSLSTVAGISKGTLLEIQRDNDPDIVYSARGLTRIIRQMIYVENVDSVANTITFSPPLFWDFNANASIANFTKHQNNFSGLEDMTIDHTNSGAGVSFNFDQCYGCWVKNVKSVRARGFHSLISYSLNGEIRDSVFYSSQTKEPNNGGIVLFNTNTAFKIENNVLYQNFPGIEFQYSSSGNYIGYNYGLESNKDGFLNHHGPHDMMNLWEGNSGEMFQQDGYFGSGSHDTLFRNSLSGRTAARPISLNRASYYYTVVGNVLGSAGVQPTYYDVATEGQSNSIYWLGYPNSGNSLFTAYDFLYPPSVTNPPGLDPKVRSTLLRFGNYDYFHKCVWDDSAGTCLSAADLSALALPASLIYTGGRPSWWPGSVAWPAIGPDVSGLVNKIPAQICFEQGKMPNCAFDSSVPPVTPPPSTPDTTAPVTTTISASSLTSSGATITWNTNEGATTQVEYGLTTAYGNKTALNSSYTTSHTQALTNLSANTLYHYRVLSIDQAGNVTVSTDQTFATASVTVVPPTTTGGSGATGGTPAGGGGAAPSTPSTPSTPSIPTTPSSPTVPSTTVPPTAPFLKEQSSLGARNEEIRKLQTFLNNQGFTVAVSGPGSKGQETDYFGPATAKALATFQATNNLPQGSLNQATIDRINTLAKVYSGGSAATPTPTTKPTTPATNYTFTRSLKLGMTGTDVKQLQIFLNNNGYTIATTGAGSKGNESTYFGPATYKALMKFQLANRKTVLDPYGYTIATGFFGPATLKVVNQMWR